MNKWADAVGSEIIINYVTAQLSVENPESRGEGLKWILEHEDAIKDADHSSMIKPLISCLTDKSKAIRDQAERVIIHVMPIVGYQEFLGATKDFKTAVQQTLKPILEKIKTSCGDAAPAGGAKKEEAKVATSKNLGASLKDDEEKAPPQNSFAKAAAAKKEPTKKREASKSPAAAAAPRRSKAPVEEDSVRITPLNKAKRAMADSRTKYPLNEVKGDHVEKLQNQCTDAFGLKFCDQMFAKAVDFNKHIKCVEQLGKFITEQPDELIEILDIIFKWANLRMTESSNTKLALSIFDFYAQLLQFLAEHQYQLQDFEAVVLIATLADKCGLNSKVLQEKVR